jgi:hypothetical protein
MKTLVLATVFMCVGSVCQNQEAKVEPKLCTVGTTHAEINMLGNWVEGRMGIKCHKDK